MFIVANNTTHFNAKLFIFARFFFILNNNAYIPIPLLLAITRSRNMSIFSVEYNFIQILK